MAKRTDKKKPGGTPLKNPKHELFAWLYAGHHNMQLFGNGTRCYMQAFGYNDRVLEIREKIEALYSKKTKGYTVLVDAHDRKIKSFEKTASVEAARILANPSICARCDFLIDQLISNDNMDRELAFTAMQREDLNSKVAAIREYNRVKDRSTDRLQGEITYRWGEPEGVKK